MIVSFLANGERRVHPSYVAFQNASKAIDAEKYVRAAVGVTIKPRVKTKPSNPKIPKEL